MTVTRMATPRGPIGGGYHGGGGWERGVQTHIQALYRSCRRITEKMETIIMGLNRVFGL